MLLAKLREEINPDPIQYGGVPGAGVKHLLIEVWERILGGLEVPEVAVTLLGIDYEKPFNRMSHNECLTQLALNEASQESVDLVGSFLLSRAMISRVGNTTSSGRNISSGSPPRVHTGLLPLVYYHMPVGQRPSQPGRLPRTSRLPRPTTGRWSAPRPLGP